MRNQSCLAWPSSNKTILVLDLLPLFNKRTPDQNTQYYPQLTKLPWTSIAALHNHMRGQCGICYRRPGNYLSRLHEARPPLLVRQ